MKAMEQYFPCGAVCYTVLSGSNFCALLVTFAFPHMSARPTRLHERGRDGQRDICSGFIK